MALNGFPIANTKAIPIRNLNDGEQITVDYPVCPCLPIAYRKQHDTFTGGLAWAVIKGEPVGYGLFNGKWWTFPCTGRTTGAKCVYTQDDVDLGTEDIDNPGSKVTAAGTSSASLPIVIPMGFAFFDMRINYFLSSGTAKYTNWSHEKEGTLRIKPWQFAIPYYRSGTYILRDPKPGDYLQIANIANLSQAMRPVFEVASLQQSSTTAPVSNLQTLTFSAADPVAEEIWTIAIGDWSVVITAKTSGADATKGEFNIVTGNYASMATNFAAAITAIVDPRVAPVTATTSTADVLVVSKFTGTRGEQTHTDAMTGVAVVNTTPGVDSVGLISLGSDIPQDLNLAFVVGRVQRILASLDADGYGEAGLNWVDSPVGSGVASGDTGGVPSHLAVIGNTTEGLVIPSDYTKAGEVAILVRGQL